MLRRKEVVNEGFFEEMAFKLDLTLRDRERCSRRMEWPMPGLPALVAAVGRALGWILCSH